MCPKSQAILGYTTIIELLELFAVWHRSIILLATMRTSRLLLLATCLMCGCSSSQPGTPAAVSHGSEPLGQAPPFIYVSGEFHAAGRYAWTNGMRLKDAFAAAGGFTDFAWHRIRLVHWDGTMEMYRWSSERPLTKNPLLKPGDKVINPRW